MFFIGRNILKAHLKKVLKKEEYKISLTNDLILIDHCYCKYYDINFKNGSSGITMIKLNKLNEVCLIILCEDYADKYIFMKNDIYHIHLIKDPRGYLYSTDYFGNYIPVSEHFI